MLILLTLSSYLSNFTKARRVNGSVFGDGHCVPALILWRCSTSWGVRATPTSRTSTHSTSWTSTRFLPGDESLLHFHLLPVFLQLSIFVDLVDGFGPLISSSGNPVILGAGCAKKSKTAQVFVKVPLPYRLIFSCHDQHDVYFSSYPAYKMDVQI